MQRGMIVTFSLAASTFLVDADRTRMALCGKSVGPTELQAKKEEFNRNNDSS